MSTVPSADAKAVVRALEGLTTQVRRLADTRQSDFVLSADALDDDATTPATTCSARYTGPNHPWGECIRAAGHQAVTDHTDDLGNRWTEAVAVYPLADSTVRIGRRAPMDPVHILGAEPDRDADDTCRRMETRTCPPSYYGPCGARPCARFESEDPTPWLDTAETPTADEDEQRVTRRASLRNLLGRVNKGALTTEECALLWQHVDTEMREHDTMRAVAAGNKRHVQIMYADLVQAQKERSESDEAARRALEQRQEMAAERFVIQEQRDAADKARAEVQRDRDQHAAILRDVLGTFAKALSDDEQRVIGFVGPTADPDTFERWSSTVAPTVERPWWDQVAMYEREAVEATRHVLELKAAVKRVRAIRKAPSRSEFNTLANAQDNGWDAALREVRAALDGTEQPTTEA